MASLVDYNKQLRTKYYLLSTNPFRKKSKGAWMLPKSFDEAKITPTPNPYKTKEKQQSNILSEHKWKKLTKC